jgi:hypothetical protein
MSFWRHEEIYRSDVGLGKAGNGNGRRRSPRSSAAMSFPSAIPRQVALQQSLPPLYRLETILNNQCCRTMILQRTATTPLTPCLSQRVHSTAPFPGAPSPKHTLVIHTKSGRPLLHRPTTKGKWAQITRGVSRTGCLHR